MANPHPATASYTGDAGRAYHGDKRGLPPVALPWVAAVRARLFQPHVRETDAVFEFGCGAGWNLAALQAARRVGFDVADFLRPEVEAAGAEFVTDTAALPDAAFDAVIAHHALEHVEEPRAVLGELRRLLKPGGTLLAAVPYEKERRYRRFDPAEPNRHLYSWNPQTFGTLLTVAGFAVREIGLRRYGYDRRAAVLAARLGLCPTGFRTIRGLLRTLRPLHEVAAVAGRP
ncbi:MAG: class I SAM-dependent methyltransferase [Limisphaerales bacterium]